MKLSEIEAKIQSMQESEYFESDELEFLSKEINQFIISLDGYFGDNDGERLDTDSLEFVFELIKLRALRHFGEYDD